MELVSEPISPSKSNQETSDRTVSSPASTGGAGNVFEQAVGGYLLSQLLVGAIPPVLVDCSVVEIAFQTEYRGWKTDDFLLVGRTASGQERKLAGQVKRRFTVSSVDADFRNAILDFWSDLQNENLFSIERDRFAFVVQRGSNTLLQHFGGLLDCARASVDAADFDARLTKPGFLSATAVRYCDEIVQIVKESGHPDCGRGEIFALLRALHIISLDLATSTRQSEAHIKSLLMFATKSHDKAGTASRTWNELVILAADAATTARAFRRNDLPENLIADYRPGDARPAMVDGLRGHTELILKSIRSSIGDDLHLSRRTLVQEVLNALEDSRIALLSGAAGNGKSAVAKEVFSLLSHDHFAFAFRAEEFGQPHLDTTFVMANIEGRAAHLTSILAAQGRKIILVDSVERLLEKSTRDAFADLLTLVKDDPAYRIILTCRDYSADLVRAAFLGQFGSSYSVVAIPTLSDEELDEVKAKDANLAIPLVSSHLRKVLANAYVLDKARSILWSKEEVLPESEKTFRDLFWREIVRGDQKLGLGLPQKRDAAFIEIALRRARALSIYASSSELDSEALASLIQDSLVVHPKGDWDLVAPAHDVLEDWSILRWLDRLYGQVGENLAEFQNNIGGHPALRRAYRKWMGELLEWQPTIGQSIFQEALTSQKLTASFADDTIVALLQSAAAESLVAGNEPHLISGDQVLLRRAIHLLRLACVTTPDWAQGHIGAFSLPKGGAWAAVIGVVRRNWSASESNDDRDLLVLGLLEDWAKGISVQEPYPDGSKDVAELAYLLLKYFDNYRHKDELKRTIEILSKIPKADLVRYEAMLLAPKDRDRERSRVAEELQEMLFSGAFYVSFATARDCSAALVSALRSHLLSTDEDAEDEYGWSSMTEVEPYFGLKNRVGYHYFPESAYRTPMLALLRQHPRAAIDFLVQLFNEVVEHYAHPRLPNPLEPAFEVNLTLSGGRTKRHWANGRLWQLYRGTSVGPNVLQCYLMALERWLRELAKQLPDLLDQILVELLSRTECAAIAGVVAAVATAFPFQAGETILCLMSVREYFALDRERMVADISPPSQMFAGLRNDPHQRVMEHEREEADKWPSRKDDLEAAVRNLQMTHLAPRVQTRLDELRAALGPVDNQDDEDRLWRLALHRMDFRGYKVANEVDTPEEFRKDGFVLMEADAPEPDIQELLDRTNPPMFRQQQRMGLLMWAFKAFKGELPETELTTWRERLAAAMAPPDDLDEEEPLGEWASGGPAITAAFVVRDHWDKLSEEERDWAIVMIAAAVETRANNWHHIATMQRNEMSPDRSCAAAAMTLPSQVLTKKQKAISDRIVPMALTHPVDEVRWYVVHAVSLIWGTQPNLALRSVQAIAKEASLLADLHTRETARPYPKRRSYEDMALESAMKVRSEFWKPNFMQEQVYDSVQLDEWHGAEAQNKVLTILKAAPSEPLAVKAFRRAAERLVAIWETKHDHDRRRERRIEADLGLADLIEQFVLRAPLEIALITIAPIVEAIAKHPGEVEDVVRGILHVEDQQPNTKQFWELWKLFATRTKTASWIRNIDREHSSGGEMIHALFLGTQWKETTRHWRSLEGHVYLIEDLFESLGPSSTVMDAYVRLLYHVGEQSLPQAFTRIWNKASEGDPRSPLGNSSTRYRMEVLLQRYVYSKPLLLKGKSALREAVLMLLDTLIDLGSSAAFRMRDDFVTPISA
jgi:hypothetical protein